MNCSTIARMRTSRAAPLILGLLLASSPALSLGPVDGEVTALYWRSTTEVDDVREDSPAVGGRAELWFFKKLGVSGTQLTAELEGTLDGTDLRYRNLDVKWRVFSPTENNFLALGLGWQEIDESGDATSGPRAMVEGRVGLVGFLYVYGRGAYLANLDDWQLTGVPLTDGTGHELEAGVQLKPFPFLQLFAGYRRGSVTFDGPAGDVDVATDGALIGIGVNF